MRLLRVFSLNPIGDAHAGFLFSFKERFANICTTQTILDLGQPSFCFFEKRYVGAYYSIWLSTANLFFSDSPDWSQFIQRLENHEPYRRSSCPCREHGQYNSSDIRYRIYIVYNMNSFKNTIVSIIILHSIQIIIRSVENADFQQISKTNLRRRRRQDNGGSSTRRVWNRLLYLVGVESAPS